MADVLSSPLKKNTTTLCKQTIIQAIKYLIYRKSSILKTYLNKSSHDRALRAIQ